MTAATLEREARTQDALTEAHDQLVRAVESLVTSDDWQAMLATASRFHTYSPSNVLLIMLQCPDATRVAGYRKWQELRRQVRKGERGIRILAPVVVKRPDPEKPGAEPRPRVVGFRSTSVFDISQTDGEDLPDISPELLTGEDLHDSWTTLAKWLADAGWMLERGDCNGANGYTFHAERTVRVREDVEPAQAVKTLSHEIAHVLMHGDEKDRTCRGRIEVEAESVAYLVSSALGLDSGSYSFPYVAGWSGGDVEVIKATAERVMGTARRILDEVA